ncbi:hypothetical protein PYW08_004643 [Mythimna loreyi]|uniref:Uncharacterized protein n=1 Tax=Mythimna loreyi TaxID=667449 RepID=A0ACC2QUL7_9NEOP|nr:hypothetical protein PYW08_004643 [Mythimna loreyi]
MSSYKAFLFLLIFSLVKSEMDFKTMCRNDYRNMNNDKINVSKYCSDNICIEKCCGEGEMFNKKSECINAKVLFSRFNKKFAYLSNDVDYSKIALYSWDGYEKQKSKRSFVFIQNHRLIQNCTTEYNATNEFFILEDGSIRMQDTIGSKLWSEIKRLQYCVEFKVVFLNKIPTVKLVMREYNVDTEDDEKKSVFMLIGLLISSFFLVLVLVVYCLLPKLQNLIGLVLMAYTLSILVTFLLKIIIYLGSASFNSEDCKIITPMLYFAAISSFFWLNVMSYDVWWSLRGHRKRCDINRRGELVKFLWYCLYAWGAPLLITAIVTTLDNIKLENLNIYKPPFSDCFVNPVSIQYYFIIPIGVIIFVNIILFLLTVYNIWMIKRAVLRSNDSRSSKQDSNRFMTYIKLSVVMGVSWCLELVPSDSSLWVYILVNTFNLLIGVAIFFLFVFKKQIYIKLCKRFNIKNRFTERRIVSQTTRTGGTTRSTKVYYSKDQSHEMDLLKDCPK